MNGSAVSPRSSMAQTSSKSARQFCRRTRRGGQLRGQCCRYREEHADGLAGEMSDQGTVVVVVWAALQKRVQQHTMELIEMLNWRKVRWKRPCWSAQIKMLRWFGHVSAERSVKPQIRMQITIRRSAFICCFDGGRKCGGDHLRLRSTEELWHFQYFNSQMRRGYTVAKRSWSACMRARRLPSSAFAQLGISACMKVSGVSVVNGVFPEPCHAPRGLLERCRH